MFVCGLCGVPLPVQEKKREAQTCAVTVAFRERRVLLQANTDSGLSRVTEEWRGKHHRVRHYVGI